MVDQITKTKLTISKGVQAGHTVGQVVAGRVRPAEFPTSGRRVEVWSGAKSDEWVQNQGSYVGETEET